MVVKRVTLIKLPKGVFFKIYQYQYADLLFEVKVYIINEHLSDDFDEVVGTVAEGIGVSFESGIVFYNIMSCIHKFIADNLRAFLDILVLLAWKFPD